MKKPLLIIALLVSFASFAQLPKLPIRQVDGLQDALNSIAVPWYYPENYGAVGNGSTNDAAAFQACIDAMPSRGGVMYLQAKTYLINTKVNITKPIRVLGSGADNNLAADSSLSASTAPTKLLNTNGTSSIFDVQSPAVTIEKIAFEHTGTTPVSGCYAVYVSTNDPTVDVQYASGFKIYDCSFAKFYNNIHIKSGWEYQIQNCYIMGAKNANVYVDNVALCDGGDGTITGCLIYGRGTDTTTYGIYHHCGGGLRVVNNKFNAWTRIAYFSDISQTTVSRVIADNSFENYLATAIVFVGSPTTFFVGDALITITGNQFAHYSSDGLDSTYHIIARNVNGLVIGNNQINGQNTKAIFVDHSQNVTIGTNQYMGMTGKTVTVTNSTYEAPTIDKISLGQIDGQADRYDNVNISNSTGVPVARLGVHTPFPSYGSLYLGGVTPDGTNATILGDGSVTNVQGTTDVNVKVANNTIIGTTGTEVTFSKPIIQTFNGWPNYQFRMGSLLGQSISTNNVSLMDNIYHNGSTMTRLTSGYGYGLQLYNGQLILQGAGNGTGDFTQSNSAKFDYLGNFGVGAGITHVAGDFTGAKFMVQASGDVTLITTPATYSTGGRKMVVRNSTTGNLEIEDVPAGGGGMTNPMTNTGDLIYSSDNSGTPARLAAGTNGYILSQIGGVPAWVNGATWSGLVGGGSISASSGSFSVTAGTQYYINTGSSASTYNLPAISTNRFFYFKNAGSSTMDIVRNGTDVIWNTSSVTSITLNAGESALVVGGSTSWYVLFKSSAGGSGTVTDVSVASANGFAGSVATSTTTPAITISTTVTGLLKGNGTAISAATAGTDYVAPSGSITGTATGSLINIRYLTSGTLYTPTSGTTKVDMVIIGAGGGGGGASGAASSVGAGAGGGAGAIVRKSMVTVSDATSYTYAIGTAGTAGANTGGNGGAGGNTSITISATTYTANGGTGGTGQTAGTALALTLGGAAGTGTNGDVNGAGQNGDNGARLSGTVGMSGGGGTSSYGAGGAALAAAGAGNNGTGFGAGGGGALSTANTNRAGGAGTAGLIIIYEYK